MTIFELKHALALALFLFWPSGLGDWHKLTNPLKDTFIEPVFEEFKSCESNNWMFETWCLQNKHHIYKCQIAFS